MIGHRRANLLLDLLPGELAHSLRPCLPQTHAVTHSTYSLATKSEITGNVHRIAVMENHKNTAAASVDSASQPRTCQNREAQ